MDRRGQSETVGTILMVAVIIVLVTVAGGALLLGNGGVEQEETTRIDIDADATTTNLTLAHAGGDRVNASQLLVVVRNDTEERRFTMSRANLTDGQWSYDPGNTLDRWHNLSGDSLDVLVVDTDTESVVLDTTVLLPVRPPPSELGPAEWSTASDWDEATKAVAVVHESYGDHDETRVELGYGTDEPGLLAHWPLDGNSGTDASPNGNDASSVSATSGVDGLVGTTAFEFSGSDRVTVPDSASLDGIAATDAFTVSGWVQTTQSDTAFLWSQFDGFGPDSASDDVVLALRNDRLGVLAGGDAALSRNETVRNETEWNEGTYDGTTVRDGQLELGRDRDAAYGQLSAPTATGTERVDVGFEPDLVVFQTSVQGAAFNETVSRGGSAFGTGTGVADCTGGSCTERARSFGTGSSSPNGQTSAAGQRSVHQVVTNADGSSLVGTVEAEIASTDRTGFDLQFNEVVSSPSVQITYRAYTFNDSGAVDVGHVQTTDASTPGATGTQEIDVGFKPNSIQLFSGPQVVTSSDRVDENGAEFGWSRGWAVDNESKDLTSETTTLGETGQFRTPVETSPTKITWKEVTFDNTYTDPVVVGTANTQDGEDALTFQVRNVTENSAEMRLCEVEGAQSGCDSHGVETLSYAVINASKVDQFQGIDAGTRDIDGSFKGSGRTSVGYSSVTSSPIVLANTQTTNDTQPVVTRVTGRDASGFDVGLCEHDSTDGCNASHGTETVGWVALDPATVQFDQTVEGGTAQDAPDEGEWAGQSLDEPFAETPAVVASTMTNDGSQEVKVDGVRNVGTDSAEVRFCEIDGGDTCDTHRTEDVGWVAFEANTSLSVTVAPRPEQVVLATSAYANNIDDHVYAASDERILNTLWTKKGGIDGRVHAHLDSFDTDGFTLDYTRNNPDASANQFPVTYVAVNSTVEPELGHARTPEATGTQRYNTSTPLTDVSLFGTNFIPQMDTEAYSGGNLDYNHFGWMTGGGKIEETEGQALGFSSHSNSVNAHAVSSRDDRPFSQLYADRNGNVLGSDVAAFDGTSGENFTLDWRDVTTTDTSDVKFDRSLFVWHSYGGEMGPRTSGEYRRTIDAGQPVYWNGTALTGTVPAGTSVDVNYSDGTDWYDDADALPKTQTITYNISLTTALSGTTPSLTSAQTEYRGTDLTPLWVTDTQTEWDDGTTSDTTVNNDTLELSQSAVGEAGTVTSDGTWQSISFEQSYSSPVVVGTTNTRSGENAVTIDVRSVSSTGAEIRACEIDGGSDGCDSHPSETVGYLVVDADAIDSVDGIDAGTLTQGGSFSNGDTTSVNYDGSITNTPVVLDTVQTDPGTEHVETRVKNRDASGFTVGICHQGSTNGCDSGRASETIGWVAIESGSVFRETAEVGETGADVGNSNWKTQSFSTAFAETPVVVASTMTENGAQEVKVDEAQNVDATGAEVRYCELESGNAGDTCDGHNQENVGWVALEPGPLTTADSFQTSGTYERTLTLDREVDWQESTVVNTTTGTTDVTIEYDVDGTTYSTLGGVPNSDSLTYRLTLSGPGDETPTVGRVNVSYDANSWRMGSTTVTDGNWHHVATTYDGGTLSLYVDGELDAQYAVQTDIEGTDADRTLGGEPLESATLDGKLEEVRVFDESRSATAVGNASNVTDGGLLVTDRRAFDDDVDPSNLELTNVASTIPTDTSINVTVESDPDVDGNYEETSDTIQLDGSSTYTVSGLDVDSQVYRLRVELDTDDESSSPSFDGAELGVSP